MVQAIKLQLVPPVMAVMEIVANPATAKPETHQSALVWAFSTVTVVCGPTKVARGL